MKCRGVVLSALTALAAASGPGAGAWAATGVQIGGSGKTFASGAVLCATDAATGASRPMVEAGLFNPKHSATASVSLNGGFVAAVTATDPVATVWLAEGGNSVVVAFGRKTADSYAFTVGPYQCSLPDTSGNWFSADGTLEYAASGKSYAPVRPGCAPNPATGQTQPYVHLFDDGGYLFSVSVNGIALTQLSTLKTHTPAFLGAGRNVISAANGSLSVDYYVRDGGDGHCVLIQ